MKKTLIALAGASILVLSTCTFAQEADATLLQEIATEINALPSSLSGGVASAVKTGIGAGFTDLQTYIGQLYIKGKKWVNKKNHTPNPNLANIEALNGTTVAANTILPNQPAGAAPLTLMQAATAIAQTQTSNNIQDSLTQFFYSMNKGTDATKNLTTASGEPFDQYIKHNSTEALTTGESAAASDSLYITDPTSKVSSTYTDPNNTKKLAAPAAINNAPFDYSNLITPLAYTTAQATNARLFLKYAARSTQNLTESVDLSPLFSNPKALLQIKGSEDYQKFMMTIRNAIAVRSISLNILNELIAERTPIPNAGSAIGQPNQSASPLQIANYRATNDLQTPAWYAGIENAEPATVQRDILIALKEIERQNYESQIQNEHLLSAMVAMTLQSNASTIQMALQMQGAKVQADVKAAVAATNPPPTNSSNAPGSLASGVVVSAITTNSANVAWGAVKNAPSTTTYTLTATDSSGNMIQGNVTPSTAISGTLMGLTPGTSYTVTVTPSVGTGGTTSFTSNASNK